jgi:hypothetical protein
VTQSTANEIIFFFTSHARTQLAGHFEAGFLKHVINRMLHHAKYCSDDSMTKTARNKTEVTEYPELHRRQVTKATVNINSAYKCIYYLIMTNTGAELNVTSGQNK